MVLKVPLLKSMLKCLRNLYEKKSHIWVVYFDNLDDKLGWWRGETRLTRKLAREAVKENRLMYPRFKWKIIKKWVYV